MNTMQLDSLLSALWRSSLQAGVVVALVLTVQWLFRKRLAPRWRAALWLVVVARLLLPFSFSSAASVFNFLPHAAPPSASAPLIAPRVVDASVSPAPASKPSAPMADFYLTPPSLNHAVSAPAHSRAWPWQAWVFAVWLAGALFLFGHIVTASIILWRQCTRLRPCASPAALAVFEECCERFGLRRRPGLLEGAMIGSPALHGLFRPRLLLPQGFAEKFSPAEMRFIFLHEMAHLKRRDLPLNWLMVALQAAHWFNPLVWFGFGRWRADRELACDAMALEIAGPEQNCNYGRTLLRLLEMVAQPVSTPGLVGIFEDKRQLRRRIDMIAGYIPARGWPLLALLLLAGVSIIGLTDAQSRTDAPPAAVEPSELAQKLVGTWVLVGKPGDVHKVPSSGGRYKFFTGSHWCITQAAAKDGVVIFHHGGTYKIKGDEYFESVEYANPTTMSHIGHKGWYKIKIEGDTLTSIGEDNPWREVWKRVPGNADPASLQANPGLIGAWYYAGTPDKADANLYRLKLITPSGWLDTESDAKTGVVLSQHGGDFTLKGNHYVEDVKYGTPEMMPLIGQDFKFDIKLDGDTLHLIGVDNPFSEIWKRASDNATQPTSMADPAQNASIAFGGQDWLPWRTLFTVQGDKLMTLPQARPGFDYGHTGMGRGPTLMSSIGSPDLKNYRAEFEYCVTGVNSAFNPYGLPEDYHDGDIFFHVVDAKENWNQCGNSMYILDIKGDGTWDLRCVYNDYCAVPSGWGDPRHAAERRLVDGNGLKIDRVNGNKFAIEINGQRIRIWVDGEKIADLVDDKMDESFGGQKLDHGGVGFHWGLDAMGWIRNFSLKPL